MTRTPREPQRPKIGLALGSGSARGLAHVGVIQGMIDVGIAPDIVCGTSIGAMVGAVYATGNLEMFDKWVRGLNTRETIRYMDIKLVVGGGFADGKRLIKYFRDRIGDLQIEELPKTYAAVATDLRNGHEVWLTKGSLWDAVRASIALPGILTPYKLDDQWLVDGGLVNPVPVSVCRALGAEVVVAVNVNGDIIGRHLARSRGATETPAEASTEAKLLDKLSDSIKTRASLLVSQWFPAAEDAPGLFEVLAGSLNIMQDRITRSRLAGEPPDVMLTPRLGDIGLLEFDRAAEAIEEGGACVQRMLPALEALAAGHGRPPP